MKKLILGVWTPSVLVRAERWKGSRWLEALLLPSGQHNDARMNLAIGLTAARYGAVVANYTEVVHLLKSRDPQTGTEKVCGARCRDVITGERRRPLAATCSVTR